MSTTFTIEVDDEDAADCPEAPWTANIFNPEGNLIGTGFGLTPAQAVATAMTDAHPVQTGAST